MKALPWILVVLLLGLLVWMYPHKQLPDNVRADTIIIRDTVRDIVLKPIKEYIVRIDTTYLPILIDSSGNEIIGDSAPVLIPITKKEYRTDQYRAIISGYHPNLDSIETYCKKEIITIQPKRKRWGVGLQAGYGYPGGAYVGIGMSYNLFMW